MIEKGYKGGLVSRVTNKHSGKKYIVSTAQEIGKDYWASVVAPSKFFGLWMDFNKGITWVRNNKEDAYKVHSELKKVVENLPENEWTISAPRPGPPEGYSKDSKNMLKKKLGIDPEDPKAKELWTKDEDFKAKMKLYGLKEDDND